MQMEICSHMGLSINDVNSLHGFCMDTLESTNGVLGGFSMDELEYGETKFLNIQDDRERFSGSILPNDKCVFQTKDVCGEAYEREITTGDPQKVFSKMVTFPCVSKTLSCAVASAGEALKGEMNDDADAITSEILTHEDDADSVNAHCSDSPSLPASVDFIFPWNPLKPVSAMKGSREKRGVPRKKLTVNWAPDVYDPVPTSGSHMVTNRPRKHNKKKPKKSGSKLSRGGKGKDKRQVHKRGGNSCNMHFKLCEQEEEVISFSEILPSAMDFHVGIPDPFCGSSFVNRYGSSLHLSSVAEAT